MRLRKTIRKGHLLAATAVGALLFTASSEAAERQLISGDNILVVADDGWCGKEVDITIVSAQPEQHYTGSLIEVQRLLGGLRAVLPFECPEVSKISFTATDGARTPVLEGSISESSGWRLTEVWEVEPPVQVAEAPPEKEEDFINEGLTIRKREGQGAESSAAEQQPSELTLPTVTPTPPVVEAAPSSPDVTVETAQEQSAEEIRDRLSSTAAGASEEADEKVVVHLFDRKEPEATASEVAHEEVGEVADPAVAEEADPSKGPVGSVMEAADHLVSDESRSAEAPLVEEATTEEAAAVPEQVAEIAAEEEVAVEAAPPVEEDYETALRRLWNEAAVDLGQPEGDLIGLWKSPGACGGQYGNPIITVTVTGQDGDDIEAILRHEYVDQYSSNSQDRRSRLSLHFVGFYEGIRQENLYALHVRDDFHELNPSLPQSTSRKQDMNNRVVRFYEEVPDDFEPDKTNCARTLVRVSNSIELAEKQLHLRNFARKLSDYAMENPIRGGLIGAKKGSGFTLPSCVEHAAWATKFHHDDNLIIGNMQVHRRYADDDFIPVFGVSFPQLTQEQRQEMYDHARSCRQQDRDQFDGLRQVYGSNNTFSDVRRLLEAEHAITTAEAGRIQVVNSDPKYFLYALNSEVAQGITMARYNSGVDVRRSLQNLSDAHREEFERRYQAMGSLYAGEAAEALVIESLSEEPSEIDYRILLQKLTAIRQAYRGDEKVADLRAEIKREVSKFADERLEETIQLVEGLQNVENSLAQLDGLRERSEADLKTGSREMADRFREAVAAKQKGIQLALHSEADAGLQEAIEKARNIRPSLNYRGGLEQIREQAREHLRTASKEGQANFLRTLDEIDRSLDEAVTAAAVAQVVEVEERVSAIPASLEGWEQLKEAAVLIFDARQEQASPEWQAYFKDSEFKDDLAARLDNADAVLAQLREEIPENARADLLAKVDEVGIEGVRDLESEVEELTEIVGNPEWGEELAEDLRIAFIDWIAGNADTIASQLERDRELLDVVPMLYLSGAAYKADEDRKRVPEQVAEVLVALVIDDVYDAVQDAHGVNLREAPDKREAMPASALLGWETEILMTALEVIDPISACLVLDKITDHQRKVIAEVTQKNADQLYSFVDDFLQAPINEDWLRKLFPLFGVLKDADQLAHNFAASTHIKEALGVKEQEELERVLAMGKRYAVAGFYSGFDEFLAGMTWGQLGYPEVDAALAKEHALAIEKIRRVVRESDDFRKAIYEVASNDFDSRDFNLGYYFREVREQRGMVSRELGKGPAGEVAQEVLDAAHRATLQIFCEAPVEEAQLSAKDRKRLLLSSGGRGETLESLACRMHVSGSKMLQYKSAGAFSDEHELMFETPEGDVLTAILVEAEVRPGEKLLVGKAMKDPLSQWDISASAWRKQVEELVATAEELDPDGELRRPNN